MSFLPPTPWTPDSDGDPSEPMDSHACTTHEDPVALRVRIAAESSGVPGSRVLHILYEGRRIARTVCPEPEIPRTVALLRHPVSLLLVGEEIHTDTLQGMKSILFALIPMQRLVEVDQVPRDVQEGIAAHLANSGVPGNPLEQIHSPLEIGRFQRAHDERKFPQDLRAELEDQLQVVLSTEPEELGTRALRRLLQNP